MAAQILAKLHVISLLVVCLATRTALGSKLVNVTCSQHCRCYKDTNHRISAKCDLNGLNSSSLADIYLPQDLTYLDLSSCGLKLIPVSFLRKFPNITYLNLAKNSLEDMRNDSFRELKQLRTLDLSYNRIRSLGKGLSKLENLFVKQSRLASLNFWAIAFCLPNIKFIGGVTCGWKFEFECEGNIVNITRVKQTNLSLELGYENPESLCKYRMTRYTLQCACYNIKLTPTPCSKPDYLPQVFLDCLYPLASVGLLLNLVVIFLVSTSKDLRKSPTMFLILNIAVCDLFMSFWCVLTPKFNIHFTTSERINGLKSCYASAYSSFQLMCPWMTFLFGVMQLASVVTSLLLTVERFLVIVYSMNPGVRLTKRIAAICVCTTWCFATSYNTYAVFLVGPDQREDNLRDSLSLCTASSKRVEVRVKDESGKIPLSVFLGLFYIFIFFCAIPLYIHMYIVVRKSSTQMGVKREGALARKLALLVFTNFLFSTIPLSLAPIFSNKTLQGYFLRNLAIENSLFKTKVFMICTVWVPVLLLCLNCCLNPFLFAFRHHLFKRHFRKTVQTILQKFNKEQSTPAGQQVKQRDRNRVRETAV